MICLSNLGSSIRFQNDSMFSAGFSGTPFKEPNIAISSVLNDRVRLKAIQFFDEKIKKGCVIYLEMILMREPNNETHDPILDLAKCDPIVILAATGLKAYHYIGL